MSEQQGSNNIDLDSMSLEQLHQLQQSEESRLTAITNHYATLRSTAARLHRAKKALLATMSPALEGKEIMIPLTESLYVPGKIADNSTSKVMVELGTGFYVERNAQDAVSFLIRKIKLVDTNCENVVKVITVTRGNLESVKMAMQGKMLEIRARQEGMRHQARDQQLLDQT